MTGSEPQAGDCAQLAPTLVSDYARGRLGAAAAWSVEAHLPACAACRGVLAAEAEQRRLARNRDVLLVRLALPTAGPVERAASRCGIAPHVWRLLSVTPSLRRSWLAGVALVLATAVAAAYLPPVTNARQASLLPFVALAPLLPLAGVAAAFEFGLDPSAAITTAAPVSGVWLFFIRSVAVIATSLVPVVLAALVLPDRAWLPLLIVAPALALSVLALMLATWTGPLAAAIGIGTGWLAIVIWLGLAAGSPVAVYGDGTQFASLAAVAGSCLLLALRREVMEFGWKR
jgi:anti-sigma factor RsiW